MIQLVTIIGQATPQQNLPYRGCRGFRVIGSSVGAQFFVDMNGPFDLTAFDSPTFSPRPYVNHDGSTAMRYPEVAFVGGTTAPLTILVDLDESDGAPEQASDYLGGPSTPSFQEGDIIPNPTSQGSEDMGPIGTPILVRLNGGPTLTIPGGNAVGLFTQGNRSSSVTYDITTGAGLAQDTGVIAYATGAIALWFEIVFSAVLTGSRTVDIRLARGDATQFSLFEVAPRTPAPTLAVGRLNALYAAGLGVGASPAAALDQAWGLPLPPSGVSGGARINLGAGGAELARIRITQVFSSF